MLPATPLPTYDSAQRGSPSVNELVSLWRYRDLVRQLVVRNVKVRYKRSVLGIAWSILSPLFQMVVLGLVFSSIFQSAAPNYPVYLLPGLLLWNFFAQTTSIMAAEVVGGADFWKRIYMPRTVFGVAAVITGLVHLGLALVPLAGLILVYRAPVGPSLIIVPFAVACAAMFALGVGLIISAIARYFADIVDIYQVILTAWMYLTPVIYPREIVPDRYRWIFDANPMTTLVQNFRAPIYEQAVPPWPSLAMGFGVATATLIAGWWLFTRTADDLPYQA